MSYRLTLACVAALLAGFVPGAATAQRAETPFETLTVRVGPTFNTDSGVLSDFWQRGYGAFAEVEVPFYVGRVEAGTAWVRYAARSDTLPRFDAFFAHLGWRGQWKPTSWLRLSAGPRLGNYLMRFDDFTRPGFKRESEVMIALHARVEVRLHSHWHAFAGGSYQKLFTARRIRMAYVSFGIGRDFETPSWLKALLE